MVMLRKAFLFIFMIGLLGFSCTDSKYPFGRDTVKSFGDGRFQILRASSKPNILHDGETQRTIVKNVQSWDKEGDIVFVIGTDNQLFTILNFESVDIQQYATVKDIPHKYKEIYNELSK